MSVLVNVSIDRLSIFSDVEGDYMFTVLPRIGESVLLKDDELWKVINIIHQPNAFDDIVSIEMVVEG